MSKRFPEWVNTEVVIKAIKMREEGMLSKQLNLWIENLLEIEKKSWIIDCFKENNYPLEIAEIELSNEEEDLILPSFISKEITGLTHYSNFSLANNPISEWKKEYLTTLKSN